MLHISALAAITKTMEKKRQRYIEGWIVDFPDGSPWRKARLGIKLLAMERGVKLGAVLLEAMQEYLEHHKKKE